MSVFVLRWGEWCRWGVVRGLDNGLKGWCGVMSVELWVLILCVDDRYLNILGASSFQSCGTLSISASHRVFVYDRYR